MNEKILKEMNVDIETLNFDGKHPELSITKKDEHGLVVQDICLIRPSKDKDYLELLVWEDPDDEDYTRLIKIKVK